MDEVIKEKLRKVYELINNGATEGEKAAAKAALDRIINRNKINEDQLYEIDVKKYEFSFTSMLELQLLCALFSFFLQKKIDLYRYPKSVKSFLKYEDFITIECSYEYFRRHMKKEWKKFCLPEINKCRKSVTKTKRRKQLQKVFIDRYIINSKLYHEHEIEQIDFKKMSAKEVQDLMLLSKIEGGNYNKQLHTNLLLEN